MTPFESFETDERQDAIAQDLYLEGANDAAFGQLPTSNGEIQHPSPRKQFAFGWVDGSERFSDEGF
jgi:hypothetical protein